MIKCKKGIITLEGKKPTLVAEFICIARAIWGVAPEELDLAMKYMEKVLNIKKEVKADENETVTDSERA